MVVLRSVVIENDKGMVTPEKGRQTVVKITRRKAYVVKQGTDYDHQNIKPPSQGNG